MEDRLEEKKRHLLHDSNEIQMFLETQCSEDANEVLERGSQLAVYLARSAKMLADAKQIYNVERGKKLTELIEDIVSHKYSAKIQNALVDALANDSKYLVDLLDRQNAAITHSLEWCRTAISKAKEEMRMNGFQK